MFGTPTLHMKLMLKNELKRETLINDYYVTENIHKNLKEKKTL